ncbi:MAG: hypothetical protein ABSG44_02265, partial [Thermodesulfobacteriota bacterium]
IYLPIGKWGCDRRLDNKSRMNREVHVRFREGVEVKFPRATRLNHSLKKIQRLPYSLFQTYLNIFDGVR